MTEYSGRDGHTVEPGHEFMTRLNRQLSDVAGAGAPAVREATHGDSVVRELPDCHPPRCRQEGILNIKRIVPRSGVHMNWPVPVGAAVVPHSPTRWADPSPTVVPQPDPPAGVSGCVG